ncbi:hypothetical protein AMTRI_Chr12g272010 [Amborella trichopoda]
MAMATLMRLSLCEEISLSLSPSLYSKESLMPKIVVCLSRWCSLSLFKVVDGRVCSLSLCNICVGSLSSLSRGKKMHFELCILKYVGLWVYVRRTFPISRG